MRSSREYPARTLVAALALIFPVPIFIACGNDGDPIGPVLPAAFTITVRSEAAVVTMTWTESSGATSYQATLEGGSATLIKAVGTATEAVFTTADGLEDNVLYVAGAVAESPSGEVASSNRPTVHTNFFPWDEYFPTSLHATGAGEQSFYSEYPYGGFENFTQVPYSQLNCRGCHSQTSGLPPVSGRGCERCHDEVDPGLGSAVDASLTGVCGDCHGRLIAEAVTQGYSDVHRDAGLDCMACHTLGDVHGDGTAYESMLQEGAIDSKCEDCHSMGAGHDPHGGKLDCSACHTQSVVTCYNCHFDKELGCCGPESEGAYEQFTNWIFLVNRGDKVTVGNMQTLKVGGTDEVPESLTFASFAPHHAHTITARGLSCDACHGNEAVRDWGEDGVIDLVVWDRMARTLSHVQGVVPVPPNFAAGGLRMDFVGRGFG